jgi:alpha-glucosidase
VDFLGENIIDYSVLGFEFSDEDELSGDFEVIDNKSTSVDETWQPVVKSKHAEIRNNYNELALKLREKEGPMRELEMFIRAFNDGLAFRFKLTRNEVPGDRQLTKELSTFKIPGDPKAWIAEYGGYSTSNEDEFIERNLSYLNEKSIAGMPLLMEINENCWLAITEANIDNYPAFYIGTNGKSNELTTKLVPLPGENESGIKARFSDEVYTPWRVLMIGENPGVLIESEIISNLN